MENKANDMKGLMPVFLLSCFCDVAIMLGKEKLAEWNVDYRVLLAGGGLLFLVTMISYMLYSKALRNANVQVFLRMMYGSVLVKMFVCLLAVFIYAMVAQRAVNRNGILGCFVLYILYTVLEVRLLMKMNKKTPTDA